MTRGQPFSVRLDEATERLVDAEARRTRRSRSAIVEALTEEAARTRRFPGLAFRGDDAQRRPWVIGSGLDVWEIIEMLDASGSPEALVADSHLSSAQVRLAMAYRDAYPAEIEAAVAENRRPIEDIATLYPFIVVTGR
ncbi:MAG: ribbon-helix-helix protein, CopG family [Chloroflexi bacterium]|nr:ribbon-helix-helix protein, CopG family [Chloroflexota bacterium]